MTLRQAGELYEAKKIGIESMKQEMKYLAQSIEGNDNPLGMCGVCTIRKDIATNILKYLTEYKKKLELELDLNI